MPHKVEINLTETSQRNAVPGGPGLGGSGGNGNSSSSLASATTTASSTGLFFPPCVINGAAVSKTFQILYKNEEILLNDVISLKTHLLVDASRCIEQIRKTQLVLDLELWFTDRDFGPEHHTSIECVATRQLSLHVDICRGLHYHLPVMFDYFHLSAVTVSVHGSLITLCQPYLKRGSKSNKNSLSHNHHHHHNNTSLTASGSSKDSDSFNPSEANGYDVLLFGAPMASFGPNEAPEMIGVRLRRAQLVHWQLCSILLTAIQSLRRKLSEYIHLLPPISQAKVQNLDVNPTVANLSPLAQKCFDSCQQTDSAKPANFDFIAHQNTTQASDLLLDSNNFQPEDYVTTVESDMAYLCGSAIVQWQQFLKVVAHSEKVVQHLAKAHHLQRIKRFSEAFFVTEKQRNHLYSVCDNSSLLFNEISDSLRKSQYFALLPRCDVECVALDGEAATLPIIYEERFDQSVVSSNSMAKETSQCVSSKRASTQEAIDACGVNIDERFSNLFAECPEPSPTAKRNFKDRLLTRLSFSSPRRGLREEYSPNCTTNTSSSSHRSVERRKSLPVTANSNGIFHGRINDAASLLGFKKLESIDKSLKDKLPPSEELRSRLSMIHSTTSMLDIKLHAKQMTTSESLPDLTNCSGDQISEASIAKSKKEQQQLALNAMRPPKQFRDDSRFRATQNSIAEEDFECPAFLPKASLECLPTSQKQEEDDEEKVKPKKENKARDEKDPIVEIGSIKESESNSEEATASSSSRSSFSELSRESQKALKDAEKLSILEMLKTKSCLVCGESECICGIDDIEDEEDEMSSASIRRVSAIGSDLVNFVQAKEAFRKQVTDQKAKGWNIYSDFSKLASRVPYFQCDVDIRAFCPEGLHLIICVHGLDGNSADLRLVKTYLELGLPTSNLEFLMSQRNHGETFAGFETLTDRLVQEITYHIDVYRLNPARIR